MKAFILLVPAMLWMSALTANAADHPELKAFPQAKEGMQRFVIVLPHKERGEEDAFLVELIIGKTVLTDGVNRSLLGSTISPKPLEGWGYTYYEVTGSGQVGSTLIGVPEGTVPVKKFVSGTPLKIGYNSRLPIVVYAPKGYELRYRIWTAPTETTPAKEG
ncbi:MAG: ecotin family protein [Planctomycetaceae bacterium]